MKVWTFQPKAVYEEIMLNGSYSCDITKSRLYSEGNEFKRAYDWLREKMEEKIEAPQASSYPVWVWYKWKSRNVKPDLRCAEFKYRSEDEFLIELDIPDKDVLLSDFDDWGTILNDGIISEDEKELDWFYDEASDAEREAFQRDNWNKVFSSDGEFVQGCIWQIRKEWVRQAKLCPKREY